MKTMTQRAACRSPKQVYLLTAKSLKVLALIRFHGNVINRRWNLGTDGRGLNMGLLRLLLKLFRPARRPHRYQSTAPKHRRSSVSFDQDLVQPVRQEPLRHVVEQTGQQILKGPCWVIDGDTIVINKVHIRLAGIDAPELDHPYGQNAKRALMQLCRGQVVTAITGLVAVWCRSFDSVMCSKGDEPWAQSGRMNFARMRCGSR